MSLRSALTWQACVLILAARASAAEFPAPRADDPIRFHRIFAPESRMSEWPLGREKYLPIDAAEFEQLTQSAEASGLKPPAAIVVSSSYEAALAGDQLIGRASLEVAAVGPTPTVLPLEPCNLAVEAAEWNPSEEADAPAVRAALGRDADGKRQLIVEQSGRLSFRWLLDGRRDPGDAAGFSLEFPSSPRNRLLLDLPTDLMPVIDCGTIVESETPGERVRRWHIELGGNHRLRLRITQTGGVRRRQPFALLRESRLYEVTPRGMELSAQWRIQAYHEPLAQIALRLDPELQLAVARLGDAPIPWTASPAADGRGTRVVLQLPYPIGGVERVIRFTALSRTVFNRNWRLPCIRPEGLFWQEGYITLLVPDPLRTERIEPSGCEQTGIGPLLAPRTGESANFQSFTPDATVELFVTRQPQPAAPPCVMPAEPAPEDILSVLPNQHGAQPPPAIPSDSTQPGAAVLHVNDATPAVSRAWVAESLLETWCQENGISRHQATFDVRHGGGSRLRFTLPGAARETLRGVWIDGMPVEIARENPPAGSAASTGMQPSDASNGSASVLLPADRPACSVAIQWTADGASMGLSGRLSPSFPKVEAPELMRRWNVWLPPGYEFVDPPLSLQEGFLPSASTDFPEEAAWSGNVPRDGAFAVEYVCKESTRWFAFFAFLLAASFGLWRLTGCRVVLALAAGALGAAALSHAEPFASIAFGGALGALFCLVAEWIRQFMPASPAHPLPGGASLESVPDRPGSTAARRLIFLFVILATCATAGTGKAGEPSPDPREARSSAAAQAPPLPRVFVPIDENRKPVGDKVYVPETLYRALLRRAAEETEKPHFSADADLELSTTRPLEPSAPAEAAPAVDVVQLFWLKVQPGSVAISVQFQLRVLEGRLQQMQLAVDPRLRLLPLHGEAAPAVQAGPYTSESRLLTLRWPRAIRDRLTLDLTFLFSGDLGIGNIRLPQIEMLDARTTQRRLAVSVNPALEWEVQRNRRIESMAIAEFLKSWGVANPKPQAAYNLPPGEIDWTLSTRPRKARHTVDQTLVLRFDEDRVEAFFDADLSTISGYYFQYRIKAPNNLEIESVSVLEEGVERARRWARQRDGRLTIFLDGPVSGNQKLAIRGRFPIRPDEDWPVPEMRVEQGEIRSAAIQIYRGSRAQLTIYGGRQGAGAEPPAAKVESLKSCRFVEAFLWNGIDPLSVRVKVKPNRPTIVAQQSLTVEQTPSGWTATCVCRGRVSEGVADEFTLLADAAWKGPLRADPPGSVQVDPMPDGRRRLVYRPDDAVSDEFEFRLAGPIGSGRLEQVAAPDVALLQAESLERWFLLPVRTEDRAIRWRTRGLTPDAAPSWMQTASEESVRVYRASDQPIEAELLDGDARTPSTFARLADVLLAWRDDRSCFGAAVFDFEPCGAAAQTLRMPKPYELLQLSVDGLPVEPEAVGDGAWRFTLASARRPQRIEAIFRGGVSEVDHGGRLEFSAPRLEDCRVRHTLWTLIGPTSWIPGKTREDAPQPCSDSEAELLRMQSAAGSVESPAGEHADIGSYAGRSDDMDQTANAAPAASAWNDLACRFAGKSFSRVQYAVEGSSHSLILDYRRAVAERMFFRSTPARLAASLLGLGAALAVLLRRAYSALAFATKSAQNSRA